MDRCLERENNDRTHERRTVARGRGGGFPDNTVKNSKYTIYTFLPLNLFEQFHRPLNLYFLLVALLQFVPAIAPVSPLSTLGPLLLAFCLTAVKEGYDDYQRYSQDEIDNARIYSKLNIITGEVTEVKCQDIQVGDLLYLELQDEVPCDAVALLSSHPEGVAFVSTENLDGESDAKQKDCILFPHLQAKNNTETKSEVSSAEGDNDNEWESSSLALDSSRMFLHKTQFEISCDGPNCLLREFNGCLNLRESKIGCGISNFLPASAVVRNTAFVLAMVVYTGNETKVAMTKRFPPVKWARLDQTVSRFAKGVFVLQFTLVLVCGIASAAEIQDYTPRAWYLQMDREASTIFYWLVLPTRYFLLLTVMVPISFKVMLDLSKYYISRVISWDIHMYDEQSNTAAVVNNTALAEDLGQVQYIMTDKTGTLTQNQMQFKYLYAVDGGTNDVEFGDALSLESASSYIDRNTTIHRLLEVLTLCNSAERQAKPTATSPAALSRKSTKCFGQEDGSPNGQSVWCSTSPDEVALIAGARRCGFNLLRKSRGKPASVRVQLPDGTAARYEVHFVLPFSSERGKMSVVCRTEAGQYILFMKGSDESVFGVANSNDVGVGPARKKVESYSSLGLRTLVCAYRVLSNEQFSDFMQSAQSCARCEGEKAKTAKFNSLYETIETNMKILGVTAVEDKLQDGVKESIQLLRSAGIKVWMLTGDKSQTAKQIARATGLRTRADRVIEVLVDPAALADAKREAIRRVLARPNVDEIFNDKTEEDEYTTMSKEFFEPENVSNEFLREVSGSTGLYAVVQAHTRESAERRPSLPEQERLLLKDEPNVSAAAANITSFASAVTVRNSGSVERAGAQCLIINGSAIAVLQNDQKLLEEFRPLLLSCATVICCRVTPDQKAMIVRLVKEEGHLTLAIGDGGNDVAMIQEAHVGVGIAGHEGRQASRAADYSFGQFKFLSRLLLVHGHTAYQRTAYIVQYSFYKSVIIAWIQLMYNWTDAAFSGVTYWNSLSLTLYNGMFTVPLTLFYALDVHLPAAILAKYARLYRLSQTGRYMNLLTFFGYIVRSVFHATLMYLVFRYACSCQLTLLDGQTYELETSFIPTFTALLLLQCLTILIESHSFTIIHWWSLVLSFSSYIAVFAVYSEMKDFDFYGSFGFLLHQPQFYLSSLLLAAMPALFYFTSAFKVWYFPSKLQLQRTAALLRKDPFMQTSILDSLWPRDCAAEAQDDESK